MEIENSELKRRLMDAQKYKDQLKEVRSEITKQQYQLEKRQDKLEIIADDVATCKLDLLNAGFVEVTFGCVIFRKLKQYVIVINGVMSLHLFNMLMFVIFVP